MSYASTVLQDARTEIQTNKTFELRPTMSMVTNAALAYRDQAIRDLAKIKKATTQTTTVLYSSKTDYTVTSDAKSCTPTGTEGGTSSVDLTWVRRKVHPYVEYKVHAGNEQDMQSAFTNSLYNAEASLFFGTGGIDAYIIAWLEANKSSVNAGTLGTFDTYADDTMTIANANRNIFYDIVQTEMQENNYNLKFQDIYNTAWNQTKNYYVNQGAGNSVNTAYQFNGFDFHPSNNVNASTTTYYTNGVHYIIPAGGIALVDWCENDATNITGKIVGSQEWGSMDSLFFPNIRLDYFKYETCVDSTARGGSAQDVRMTYEITANIAMAKQPTPTGTPIFKYGIV